MNHVITACFSANGPTPRERRVFKPHAHRRWRRTTRQNLLARYIEIDDYQSVFPPPRLTTSWDVT